MMNQLTNPNYLISTGFQKKRREQNQKILAKDPNTVPPAAGVIAIVKGVRDKDAMLFALSEGLITGVIMD